MRDITLGDTIYVTFTTRSFSTGVPTQLAGTPALSVLESNNATPITSGVSLSVDRASVTGLNEGTVVATGGNGYESGKSYAVYISAGTVGGVSVVGEVLEVFTIQSSAAAVDLANGTDGLGAIKADTAAILVDSNELQTDWVDGGRLDLLLDATLADTNELQADWVNGGRLDLIVDAILTDTAEIGAAGAGLTNINLPDQTMNITGDIIGNLSGSVTGAVGSVTGNVGGNVAGSVASVTGNVGGSVASVTATVDANVVEWLGFDIVGTGVPGDLWRAA